MECELRIEHTCIYVQQFYTLTAALHGTTSAIKCYLKRQNIV